MSKKKSEKELAKYRPDAQPFVATSYPFYWIARVSNRYAHNMERHLKKVNMTTTSWRTAMLLHEHGPLSMSDIANHAASRLPTITRTVYKMRENGLVEIKQQEKDARVTVVTITEKGEKTLEHIIQSTKRLFDNTYEGLSEGQLQMLNEVLKKLFDNMPHT